VAAGALLLWGLLADVLQVLGRLEDAVRGLLNSSVLLREILCPGESLARFASPAGYRSLRSRRCSAVQATSMGRRDIVG